MSENVIRHVLFDADGVLQDPPGGWYALMEPFAGERAREFLHYTWKHEKPSLSGNGDYRALLAEDLRTFAIEASVDEILAEVWFRIEVDDTSLDLVHRVRALGLGVHLGTNQDVLRAEYMRENLGYQERFDTCFYSCDVGVAKPDRGFFDHVAQQVGADPAEILFIDDSEANVEGARAAGLASIHWCIRDGHDVLRAALATHGVHV
ncbi:HAD family hydrolase [Microbacterium sp. A93]|uniref:HAD family hydrolase n=1 Tax=Microbacterium sp. A93 TaxID=3450716 RepID=UPI003F4351FB